MKIGNCITAFAAALASIAALAPASAEDTLKIAIGQHGN
jgi:hypothetical protein